MRRVTPDPLHLDLLPADLADSLVWLLAAACLVLPVAVGNWGELLTGDPEKDAAILILVMSLLGTGILVALLFLLTAERRVEELAVERGVDEPRLRLAPGGWSTPGRS